MLKFPTVSPALLRLTSQLFTMTFTDLPWAHLFNLTSCNTGLLMQSPPATWASFSLPKMLIFQPQNIYTCSFPLPGKGLPLDPHMLAAPSHLSALPVQILQPPLHPTTTQNPHHTQPHPHPHTLGLSQMTTFGSDANPWSDQLSTEWRAPMIKKAWQFKQQQLQARRQGGKEKQEYKQQVQY